MTNWILTWVQVNWLIANLLYWTPMIFCVLGYTVRTWKHFDDDVERRDEAARKGQAYFPTDTLGTLVGRAIVSLLPIANLWAATFDVAPEVFGRFFSWLGRVLDQPLVPPRRQQ